MNTELFLEMAKDAGLVGQDAAAFGSAEMKFACLILEEVMQTLLINDHGDAVDLLNDHFGFDDDE